MDPPSKRDYYADLGIIQSATAREIHRAYRTLALKHHPDKQPPGACFDAAEFRRIQEAYEFLRDEARRERYDLY
ncbi:heat shock protein DnaJ, partial [Colletotrichum caudatum]